MRRIASAVETGGRVSVTQDNESILRSWLIAAGLNRVSFIVRLGPGPPCSEKGKDSEPVMVLMPRVTIVDADKISDEAAAAVAEVWHRRDGPRSGRASGSGRKLI